MKFLKYLSFLLFFGSLLTSCFDDNDDVPGIASTAEVNDFIWKGLNYWSLYKSDVNDLSNDRFSNDAEYTRFLNQYNTPESFFEDIKSSRDRFSLLFDDYTVIERSLDGITLNNGMDYGLVRYPNNPSNVFGYVRYVLPNTDAKAKGILRGDIFNTVNGTQITEDNFSELLSQDVYTIGLAGFDGSIITPLEESVELIKSQYTENPVYLTKVIDTENHKIGYLMYNSFTSDFDAILNEVFIQFKSERITDLVLDLRYNGGGSIETSKDLSSMITGQFEGNIYSIEQYNQDRQETYGNERVFDSKIGDNIDVVSLNLNRVYVLTSGSTASASELVINCLRPYIEVIQIGTNTRGKFEGSFLIYDAPAPNFRRSQANINHRYAMLPLVLKSANSRGESDYFDGLIPDIPLPEDYSNLGVLGDENEPLLRVAIDHITGNIVVAVKSSSYEHEHIGDSDMMNPIYQRMFIED